MTKLYSGSIYLLENVLWTTINLKKIGCSSNPLIRKKSLSTALPDEINIAHQSTTLTDKYFFEHMLSKLLYKYRYKSNREFYQIELSDYITIINTIETINKLYNTEESLLDFIKNYDQEYYKNRFELKENVSPVMRENKIVYKNNLHHILKKKKRKLFIDTSY